MGREENLKVFLDTERLVKENEKLKEAVGKSSAGQILIPENIQVEELMPSYKDNMNRYSEPTKVIVSKKRTYEAASTYKDKVVCVHNFASATNPGGGVTKGSSAQEECLCRCSTLYFSLNTKPLWDGFYSPHRASQDPVHNDDCIYTPDVVVFKSDTAMPALLKDEDWYKVNVVTCAAPNLRLKPGNAMNSGDGNKSVKLTDKELYDIHVKRLTRILDVAVAGGNDAVILGAFGCGAFENNPTVVARAAKDVIKNYRNSFETIEFAVYCTPRDEQNYTIFERTVKGI